MTFIVTLVSFLIERFFHWGQLRHWQWFMRYQQWLVNKLKLTSPYLLMIGCIVPFIFLVGCIDYLLSHWSLVIIKLIFEILVVMYCLGPNNLWVQTYAGLTALTKEDPSLAISHVQAAFATVTPEDSQSFHRSFTHAIFVGAYDRVFAVLFWFVILGPMGAVLYRLVALCAQSASVGMVPLATQCKQILDWLPIRVFTFIFALGGHFKQVLDCWQHQVLKGLSANYTLLTECGVAALDVLEAERVPEDGSAEKEALSLLDRVFVMSLVILAAVVLLI